MANKIGIPYCETSAKSYESTEQSFNTLISSILKRKKKEIPGGLAGASIVLKRPSVDKKDKKKDNCC